jgi:hypothetical protein
MRLFAVGLRQLPGLAFPLIALLPLPRSVLHHLLLMSLRGLILTHIFFGSLVERNEMVEVVIHPGLIGHFTKSICKMWVRISVSSTGMKAAFLAISTFVRDTKKRSVVHLTTE